MTSSACSRTANWMRAHMKRVLPIFAALLVILMISMVIGCASPSFTSPSRDENWLYKTLPANK